MDAQPPFLSFGGSMRRFYVLLVMLLVSPLAMLGQTFRGAHSLALL